MKIKYLNSQKKYVLNCLLNDSKVHQYFWLTSSYWIGDRHFKNSTKSKKRFIKYLKQYFNLIDLDNDKIIFKGKD